MAKTTKTPEQIEDESTGERRDQLIYGHLNRRFREWEAQEAEQQGKPSATRRPRRVFPWRVRLERLR